MQIKKEGIMEEWNIGMMGKINKMPKPIIPSFRSLCPVDFSFPRSGDFIISFPRERGPKLLQKY
jgi:hypothetical protein